MFFLISFVLASKYCVEKTKGRCEEMCPKGLEFEKIFSYIPNDNNFSNSNEVHDIYIADQVDYEESLHNFIICDPSIHLIYKKHLTKIILKEHVFINSNYMLKDVPLLFKFKNNLRIDIFTEKKRYFPSIILEANEYDLFLDPVFITDNFPENLVLFSSLTRYINLFNITDNVKKLFNTTYYFKKENIGYYCISDKVNNSEKCKDYKLKNFSNYNKYNSASDINTYSSKNYQVLVYDTLLPQILIDRTSSYSRNYYHIIAMGNSDVIFYPNFQSENDDFYVIINSDSIEMPFLFFEGTGNLTLVTSTNISIYPKSGKNNNHFTLKAKNPFNINESCVHPIIEDSNYNFENKIHIADFCKIAGPKSLSGLFEPENYIIEEDHFNYGITIDTLKEYQFDYITYYFEKGTHEIPVGWKKGCRFHGINPKETNFIFTDVHYYDGRTIDNFIDVNIKPSEALNHITIKPSSYFFLDSFGTIYNPDQNEHYTIQVEKDFVMYGTNTNNDYDMDEFSHQQCKITGKGTIKFTNSFFKDKISELCEIDENVQLELTSSSFPSFHVCIGQNSIDECKSEIKDIESISKSEWIWLRNMKTLKKLNFRFNSPFYVTNDQIFNDREYYDYNLIITSKANLVVPYRSSIYIDSNRYDRITAQSPSAKLTIFYSYFQYNHVEYYKQPIEIYYFQSPKTDYKIYFYFENVKLYMMYKKNFTKKSINCIGKAVIYYREPHQLQISMFQTSKNVHFTINKDKDYGQILYADELVESYLLYDFVFCDTIEKFNSLKRMYSYAYIYKDITLNLSNIESYSRHFNLNPNVTATINVPNNTYFYFSSLSCEISFDLKHDYYIVFSYYCSAQFIIEIKDFIYIGSSYLATEFASFKFTSSKNSVEVFASSSIRHLHKNYGFTISVPENFIIYAPVPDYLEGLFGSAQIKYSTNWDYLCLSERVQDLNDPYKLISQQDFENDENLATNIVLKVDDNDILKIPNWKSIHNIYFFQGENRLVIDKPTNITFALDGLTLNHVFRIVSGNMSINVPSLFTANSEYVFAGRFIYDALLNCSQNLHTDIYLGSISFVNSKYIKFYGNDKNKSLSIIAQNEEDMSNFLYLMDFISKENIKYLMDYHYICYNPNNSPVCPRKSYIAKEFESLLNIINDYPNLPIIVTSNLIIPYSTGDHYLLYPVSENIQIDLPYSPDLIATTHNKSIQVHYWNSTFIEIMNKSIIDVKLNKPIELLIESVPNSDIIFSLGSDVLVSTKKNIKSDFNISVDSNSYHLYSENVDRFGNIFNGVLEKYFKICAYDYDALSYCTFYDNDTIENVFQDDDFHYNEVEIALSSNSTEIELPHSNKTVYVNILPNSSSILTIEKVNDLHIKPDLIIINEKWQFVGDISRLCINLDKYSTMVITGEITKEVTIQLTSFSSIIDLLDCDEQNSSKIAILKYGDSQNKITILGTNETYENFINSLIDYDNITFSQNSTQQYLCLCDRDSCLQCQEGIDGIVKMDTMITRDPGEDVKIRIFTDVEIPMNVFTNFHDVFVDYSYQVNLTNAKTVYQNIDNGLRIDNLFFENGTNLLLKPRDKILNIWMREIEPGPYFTIDIDEYLKLGVPNINNKKVSSSRIHVKGKGELNVFDYPIGRIRQDDTIKLIKGIYIICGKTKGSSMCTYESDYKKLDEVNSFENDFDIFSKIIVFLDSFENSIDVRMNFLKWQLIHFVRVSNSKILLENQKQNKVRFLSTDELISKSDSTIDIHNSRGGVSLNSSDSDLFVVGFNRMLTIKQEGEISENLNSIVIQPFNNEATIKIDESVDLNKQKMKIETENNKSVSIKIIVNKDDFDERDLKQMLEFNPDQVSLNEIIINGQNPNSKTKKRKLSKGGIAGIVVAILVVIAVIAIVFTVIEKKRRRVENISNEIGI